MIISKRQHLEKVEMAAPLKPLIDSLTNCDLEELPGLLKKNLKWERPRGDLFHWVPLLNRFDDIFEKQIKKYGLDEEHPQLRMISESDQELLIACLQFSLLLFEHCSNTSIYSSRERIFSLINTPTIDVRLAALEFGVALSEKYIQTSSDNYSAPKSVELKVLQLAKVFPPPVPSNFNPQKKDDENEEDASTCVLGDHYGLLDSISVKSPYPSKWKNLNFQYYRVQNNSTQGEAQPKNSNEGANTHRSKKHKQKSDSKSAKKNAEKKGLPEGLTSFSLHEDMIRKLSLEQIFDKASEVIPNELWFDFANVALVTRSFNNKAYESLKLREKLLRMKCLSIAFISCMCSCEFTASRYFEAEPYIFSFLVDLIQPENSENISSEVYLSAVKALEAISLNRVWGSDLIRCMSGNVSHGTLFQIIRHINRKVRHEIDDGNEEAYIRFFDILGNLIESKSLTPRLTAGGILNDLMSFLSVRSKYRWPCSAAVHLLSVLLNTAPNCFDDFVQNNGFQLLIDVIGDEVNFALDNPDYGGGAPKYTITHYSITFRQANYIRNLLKLVSHLIQSEAGDRLRNLFDSPILESFNKIMNNPSVFGPLILSATLDCVFYIIHNEPTAFSILNEAQVVDTILHNFDRFFIPSSDLLLSLPEVIGAVCLNNDGLKKVIDLNIIATYFSFFYKLDCVKEFVRSDMTISLGCSFDELGRHYPSLKPIIMEEIKNLIKNVPAYINEKLTGVKFYNSEMGALFHNKDEEALLNEEGNDQIVTWESLDAAYLADNVFYFFSGLFLETNQWGNDAISSIPYEDWAAFMTLTNIPFDYTTSHGYSTFVGILKYFDDENRSYGLPVAFKMLLSLMDSPAIQEFIHFNDTGSSFFDRFEEDPIAGTEFLKQINSLNTLLYTFTKIYINPYLMFHERFNQLAELFGAKGENNRKGFNLIGDLGLFLRRCIIEEIVIRSRLPDEISKKSVPLMEKHSDSPPLQVYSVEPPSKEEKQDGTSAKYKNTLQIRFFMYRFQNYISSLFCSIGKICMHRRQDLINPDWRRSAVGMTLELGKLYSNLVKFDCDDQNIKSCYLLVMANIILYSISQKERANRDTIHTSLAISLYQNGCFDTLKDISIEYWNRLLHMDQADAEKTSELSFIGIYESSVVKNILSQIFLIFGKIVNSDAIPNLPSAKYFYKGYNNDPDMLLIPSFLIQTRYLALQMVLSIIGSSSALFAEKEGISAKNIPSPLIEQVIFITKHIWNGKKEAAEARFVPLSVENVSPPCEEVDYLTSRGLSVAQAEQFFKSGYELADIEQNKWPQLDVDESVWYDIAEDIKHRNITFDIPSNFTTTENLNELRACESAYFTKCWFKISTCYPKVIESIADMLLSSSSDFELLASSLFGYFIEMRNSGSSSESCGSLMHLLCILLKSDKVSTSTNDLFHKVTLFMVDELKNNVKSVNETYFSHGLLILEQVILYKSLPRAEECKHRVVSDYDGAPYQLDDVTYNVVFSEIVKLEGLENIDSALAVVRILVLYAKNHDFADHIISSKIMEQMISFLRNYAKSEKTDLYQMALIVLIRRCFESKDVLQVNMAAELSNTFRGSIKGKRDLQSILRESSAVVLRDPELFVDVISKDLRLDNYDGGELFPSKLTVFRCKPHERPQEDTEMEDVSQSDKGDESSQQAMGSTGIVHYLLSELMDVSKKDWITDSEEGSKQANNSKKDSDLQVFKNMHFTYACFLLQTLVELLGSYKQPKLEFLTFSKKNNKEIKPRTTALNFLIHQLIPTKSLVKTKGVEQDRRGAISSLTKEAILALVSTPILDEDNKPDPKKEDKEMSFIRRFYVDTLSKILNDTMSAPCSTSSRYSKLVDLFDLCGALLSQKLREMVGPLFNSNAVKYDSYYISKALIDRQIPSQITSIIAEFDPNFPDIQRLIKLALKPITLLGKIKSEYQDIFEADHQGDKEDDEIVPEDDDKDDTPDLFRNSTLGMYDVEFDTEDEEMDYYDEGDALEVLSSEEEMSEENSHDDDDNELSAMNSSMEEGNDDISLDEEFEEEDYGSDSGNEDISDAGDIEIIDELNIDSNDDNESLEGDDSAEYYEYEEGDDDGSDYDEDELDGWIEAFEDENESSNEIGEEHDDAGASGVESLRRSRRDTSRDLLGADHSSLESGDDYDDEISVIDEDEEGGIVNGTDNRRRARDFASTFFDALRPAIGQSNIASLFEGLLTGVNSENGLLRGTIHISGPGSSSRSVGNMLHVGTKNKKDISDISKMYIKSTRERWYDAMNMFYFKVREKAVSQVIPAIINRIEAESVELCKKKKEEIEKARKEREEKRKRREEEERKKREEEAKERANSESHVENREPVMVRIGDREVDLSGTDIDPEFFEALPDDMREEVFTQHVRERRANATSTGTNAREIDPDFLDALPEQIRDEILQQESMARRFSAIEDDLSFPEDEEDDDELEMANIGDDGDASSHLRRSDRSTANEAPPKKTKKFFFTPLIERAGVAALIRLLFVPQPIYQREYIHQALEYACNNKQTRTEVMGLLVAVLHEGLSSQKLIEKVYSQVTIKARNQNSPKQAKNHVQFPLGASPIVVGNQVIEVINYLLEKNSHMRYYLLTEHDNPFLLKKVNPQTKLKESLKKQDKFPINFLLGLLQIPLLKEEQTFMDLLARVLQIATRPLHAIKKAAENAEGHSQPPIPPPVISEYNFSQIIKLLTLNDCPNTTFRRTISAMQNLSVLPKAQEIFTMELSDSATKLGQTIISHLNNLTKEISSSAAYDVENKSLAKLSASSSEEAKLLRILTALDYMYESREKQKQDKKNDSETLESPDEIEELTDLYKKLSLGTLWDSLSDCLRVLEERKNLTNIATALLPLIESLMVVCKHSKVKDVPVKEPVRYEAKKVDFSKEPIENLFFSFTDEHKKILNQMVRTNPNLMSGPFGMLVRNPRVLEFDNKKNYFDRKLHKTKNDDSKLAITIRRDQVFLDSYRALFFKSKDEFKNSTLEVNFKGESGIDAGGVTREWYQVLSRQMFNPDYALFTPVASDETTFHPNRTSYVNPEHLSFFKFIGKVIGKAIFDNCFLDCHFSRAVYKRILGKPVSLKDMETLDLEYFRSLMWMLENDITDVITEDFSVETDDYGEHKIIDLIPNGRNIDVTEENKHEYVKLVVEYRLQTSVLEQMDHFLQGFHEIIPKELIAIFDEQELELLISGLPDIDVTDWQNNTVYNNYSPSTEQIQWFWRAVKSFDNEERAKLLQFATGTSKVPLNGFKELTGSNGTCKFSIHRDYGSTDRLPSSHTCFNQIDLPAYESYEMLRGALLLAIREGHEGFGLA
ncbi:Piso0_001009 [Millerozyma farinosa CBS 7064]|uniref:HECT-type E3 ubiquitin transferase n=1 Tax=Pichia sorbitophila (strain ATCC MYA-4447 / BCRC 22081 / CBS 7064 / NBRC 10061 / NRRL Y-12695) TaxID=559304 RepID=G8YQN8_PICSO|nr:Piso0_001009 [Millerozyma farinosa CBS 7064]CCE78973.1 Piso0_001009 [Millerozyma farinosa CBS 7064]